MMVRKWSLVGDAVSEVSSIRPRAIEEKKKRLNIWKFAAEITIWSCSACSLFQGCLKAGNALVH
jgi:hypothetical protein